MRSTPLSPAAGAAEQTEQQLKAFIEESIKSSTATNDAMVLLFTSSADTPVGRAVLAMAPDLEKAGLGLQILFTSSAASSELLRLKHCVGLRHEIRIGSHPRLAEGHEQLVVGSTGLWFGDDMRREPGKRDAFSKFESDDAELIARVRRTFSRLWCCGRPVSSSNPATNACPDATSAEATDAQPPAAIVDTVPISDALATLAAWQASTRH